MYQLIYVSTATAEPTESDLVRLLEGSRRRNARRQVTGLILYHDQQYLQVLEGNEATVRELFVKIASDRRHTGVSVVWQGEVDTREFPDSAMAFRDLRTPTALTRADGFSDILLQRLTPHSGSPAEHFIRVFRRVSGIDN